MTTKTITLSPTTTIPTLIAQSGRDAAEGVPIASLSGWVQSVLAHIASATERESCVVLGTEHLVAQYAHLLSPIEDVQAVAADQRAKLIYLRDALFAQASQL